MSTPKFQTLDSSTLDQVIGGAAGSSSSAMTMTMMLLMMKGQEAPAAAPAAAPAPPPICPCAGMSGMAGLPAGAGPAPSGGGASKLQTIMGGISSVMGMFKGMGGMGG